MLQPSKKVQELERKLEEATTNSEKDVIIDELRQVLLKESEALKDCPFDH